MKAEQDRDVEVWESTTAGSVWIHVKDPRAKNGWRPKQVGGAGGGTRKITLTPEEREYNQEMVLDDNAHLDPFANGHLICRSGRAHKGRYELTDDELVETLAIVDDAIFADAIEDIDSEVLLRRLLALAQQHAPNARYEQLKIIVDSRYQTGGTQRSVQEMIDAGEKIGATLSG